MRDRKKHPTVKTLNFNEELRFDNKMITKNAQKNEINLYCINHLQSRLTKNVSYKIPDADLYIKFISISHPDKRFKLKKIT